MNQNKGIDLQATPTGGTAPMRRLRFRIATRHLMVLIALVAMLLGFAAARPYPVMVFGSATNYVSWSDGTSSTVDGPHMMRFRGTSWLLIVDWPDGTTHYYLPWRGLVAPREPFRPLPEEPGER